MKKCKVLSYNPHRHVIVFRYDKYDVQAYFETKLKEVPKYVYVDEKNGIYEILLKKPMAKQIEKYNKKTNEENNSFEKKDSTIQFSLGNG